MRLKRQRKQSVKSKRRACKMAVAALGILSLVGSNLPLRQVKASQAIGEGANVVVLVRFAGDSVGDNNTGYNKEYAQAGADAPRTYWEYLERRFNGVNDTHVTTGSFREYLSDMSGGQHTVESVFPQTTEDGHVVYLTMDQGVDSYKGAGGEAGLISEICEKLNAQCPQFAEDIDRDRDGTIDNLMILASVTSDGQFTPHSSNAGNSVQFAGKNVGPYTMIETRTSEVGNMLVDTLDVQTAGHEYIHTFGIPDYYRGTGLTGTPVGFWDPMGSPSGRPYPLAVTRERIGWCNIEEKEAADATYTLYDAATSYAETGKSQAIKIRTPLSSNEYFVVEYRKAGQRYTKELDQSAPASGLIVYRVNPGYADEGNLMGKDYIYVYRPGDTGETASQGDLANAQVGLANYKASRQEIGSLDLGAKITDDAICYSDGTNSGIHIQVKEQEDHSITFNITFADYANMNLWERAKNEDGTTPFSGLEAMYTRTVTDSD